MNEESVSWAKDEGRGLGVLSYILVMHNGSSTHSSSSNTNKKISNNKWSISLKIEAHNLTS